MNRLIAIVLLVRLTMLYAVENLPQDYAVGKNIRLPLQGRKSHILKQTALIDQEMNEPLKKVLQKIGLSKIVDQDLKNRDHNLDQIALSWTALEHVLHKRGLKDFILFGFGSLVNKCANYQPNINIPGVAFGIKRMYNLKHPNSKDSILGLPTIGYDHEQLRLNNRLTGQASDMANGLLLKFTLGSKAYIDLKEREKSYRLIPVKVALYRALLQNRAVFKDAYVLFRPEDKRSVHGDPHVVYNSLVLDGFKDMQNQGLPGFVPFFLDTTYLSDEQTTIRDWIRRSSAKIKNSYPTKNEA